MEKFTPETIRNIAEESKSSFDKLRVNNPEIFALISPNYNPDSPLKIINNDIETDEGVYLNIPRMQEFARISATIKESLSPVPEDGIRLWRGNRQGEVGKNPSYTNSLTGIALPFLLRYGGPLSYIDIPKEHSEKFLVDIGSAKGSEYILPDYLLSNVKIVGLNEEEKTNLFQKSIAFPEKKFDATDGWTELS